MPRPLSHKYPIPMSQLYLVNTDVPAGVGAPPLDTTSSCQIVFHIYLYTFLKPLLNCQCCSSSGVMVTRTLERILLT